MIALSVKNLQKSFPGELFRPRTEVLKSVSFDITSGRFVGLIGPNGAGKTTTIKCLLQFLSPDRGEMSLFGLPVEKARNRLGFLPERPYFQEFLTGDEFLNFHWKLSGRNKQSLFLEKSQRILNQVKLSHARNKKLKDYSKGMLQRIGIAQALIAEPDLLILDEPMSGLDPDGRILVKDILKNLKRDGRTLLMSSHLLEDIEELCDDLIILHKGETRYVGSLAEFKSSFASLEDAYRAFKLNFELDLNV
jgi:ABC-2 type transport system ATP-binding protein